MTAAAAVAEVYGSALGSGPLPLPVPASAVTSTLVPYDPQREAIAGLLRATINAHHTAAWSKITALLRAGHPLRGSLPVQDVSLVETSESLGQRRAGFPLLAVYRDGEPVTEPLTMKHSGLRQQWRADYILGPLSVDDARVLGDMLVGVMHSVRSAVRHGWHPNYGTGQPYAVPAAQFGLVRFVGPGAGKVEGVDAPYYGVSAILETLEVGIDVVAPTDEVLTGMDLTLSLAVDPLDGVTLPNFIQAKLP